MSEATKHPVRLPLPSDLSATSDDDLMKVIESWVWDGELVSWESIVGHELQIDALRRTGELLRLSIAEPGRVARLGISTSFAGAILCGPTGTGKSMMARALATAAGDSRSVLAVPTAELTASAIGRIYNLCAASGRSWLLVIDECERLVGPPYLVDEELKVAFLAALDGLHAGGSCLTVATTTLGSDSITPPAVRPGRLSPVLTLSLPSHADRVRMLEIELGRRPTEAIDVLSLADRTSGWSGAEVAGLVEESAIRALVAGRDRLSMADAVSVAGERFSLGDRGSEVEPTELMALHESAHACHVAVSVGIEAVVEVRLGTSGGHTESVRGIVDLDTRRHLSPTAKTALSRSELRGQVVGALCGMAAEEVLAGEVTTGGDHDRALATTLAGQIVTLDSPTHTGRLEYATGEYPTGSDAMREWRWRTIDALLVDCRREAEQFVACHAADIRAFAVELFSVPGQRLNGDDLDRALRRALAIE